jgi:hypothetical protein
VGTHGYTRAAFALQQTPSTMRRFLSIVLMLVLSLQATWSAAASVCRHEAREAAHFGHHVHADEGDHGFATAANAAAEAGAGAQDPLADTSAQVPHLDCVGCHGGLCGALLGVQPPVAALALPDGGRTPYVRAVTDGLPERLIRPPHAFLA